MDVVEDGLTVEAEASRTGSGQSTAQSRPAAASVDGESSPPTGRRGENGAFHHGRDHPGEFADTVGLMARLAIRCAALITNRIAFEYHHAMSSIERPHVGWWLSIGSGMTALALTALSPTAFAFWTTHLFWLPPRPFLVATLIVAVALHIGEAAYAYRLARDGRAPNVAIGWMLQTLALGYPSLRLLRRRA